MLVWCTRVIRRVTSEDRGMVRKVDNVVYMEIECYNSYRCGGS